MWAKLSKGDMRKKIIIVIITTFAVAAFGGMAVSAYVYPSDIKSMFSEYAEVMDKDKQRFKYRNTLNITRIDLGNNRIFVLFDAEYLLKMDERKQFFGDMMVNGVSELILGWPNDQGLFDEVRFKSTPLYRGGKHEYYEFHTLFKERLSPYDEFQIPDMIEVELPVSKLRTWIGENKQGRLYYYLEAFGFYTDGYIDFRSCYDESGDECFLVITGDDRLEYTTFRRARMSYVKPEPEVVEPEPEPEPTTEPEPEPEPEVEEPEFVEPEPEEKPEEIAPEPIVEPEIVEPETEVEPEPEIVEPELEPESETEPEPEPETIVLEVDEPVEPESEPEPEPILGVIEPDAEPEVIIEVASAPTSEEKAEPEESKLALELGLAALVTKNEPTGGETAVKVTAFDELLAVASKPELILTPNTGYKNREKEWEFLILPLVGAAILAVWWLWPLKIVKKVKKSSKKVLTFFANSDKMVTVY